MEPYEKSSKAKSLINRDTLSTSSIYFTWFLLIYQCEIFVEVDCIMPTE